LKGGTGHFYRTARTDKKRRRTDSWKRALSPGQVGEELEAGLRKETLGADEGFEGMDAVGK
jgi:hypothetical protein